MHEVRYSQAFSKDYERLKKKAIKGNAESEKLLLLISNATRELSIDRESGRKIQRRLWPKEYSQKYGVTNLWKYNLDSYWRLIYTIAGNEVEMFLIYLEYMPHPHYERKFKYKQ